jgi:hypothetical protein
MIAVVSRAGLKEMRSMAFSSRRGTGTDVLNST